MASIAVIIPTFNRALKTARAVASVLYQSFSDYELIVVDDGSEDNTQHVLKQFGSKCRCIVRPANQGVSAARNRGIQACDAPWLAFLDSDDYWLPRKLETQAAFFSDHPDALICQTRETWIRRGRFANPKKKHMKPSGDVFAASLRRCLVSPSAVMLHRSLLEETGLFDETLPACEDYDLWLRISCRHPVYLIEEPLAVKEGGHPDQLSARYRGMDRFRIQSIMNLLSGGRLNSPQEQAALEELAFKCRIYGTGCIKRGRQNEGAAYLQQAEKARRQLKSGQMQETNIEHRTSNIECKDKYPIPNTQYL